MSSPADSFDTRLGRWMASLREGRGISQEALAEQLGRDQSFVSKVEHGQRRITVQELLSWASALEVPLPEVTGGLKPLWEDLEGRQSIWGSESQ